MPVLLWLFFTLRVSTGGWFAPACPPFPPGFLQVLSSKGVECVLEIYFLTRGKSSGHWLSECHHYRYMGDIALTILSYLLYSRCCGICVSLLAFSQSYPIPRIANNLPATRSLMCKSANPKSTFQPTPPALNHPQAGTRQRAC